MPHGDRTGPMGQGSKTGRAMGHCSGSDSPGYTTGGQAGTGRMFSRGAGGRSMGRGTGRGFRCRRNSGLERGRGFFPGMNTRDTIIQKLLSPARNQISNSLRTGSGL